MQTTHIKIAQTWFEAFNKHNLDLLLSLYSDNADHYSPKLKIRKPETEGLIKGKKALHSWWQDSFERLPSLHYSPEKIVADDTHVFMEYTRKVAHEPDMKICEVLEIQNGLIVVSRVYHS